MRRRKTATGGSGPLLPPVRQLAAARAALTVARRRRPASPADLARQLIPGYRVTPAIALISDALRRAVTEPDQRIIISCPPRTGKSVLVSQIGPVFALADDPDLKIILASYADSLAEEHSREARRHITERADVLGFALSAEKQAVGRWRVADRDGGLLAAGILSGITGHGAGLLLLDDVVKNQQEADSTAHRRRILGEFRSTLMTRLHPNGSVVVIGTRWHEQDLIGTLLEEGGWEHINIPAIAEAGIPDALDRPVGVAMTSALGRTAEGFADIKKSIGSRSWYALFQGVPTSPEGGLIKRDWLDGHRLIAAPRGPTLTVVGVDPADSGEGDQTGIVAGSLGRDGRIVLTHDVSAHLTSDQWSNRAVELAVTIGASRIVVEGYSAAETYRRLLVEAVERAAPPYPINVSTWPPKGSPRLGDSLARSQGLIAALETGKCRIAGRLDNLEADMATWQAGQHQPDSVAAATIAFETLAAAAGARIEFGIPGVGDSASVVSIAAYLGRRIG